MADSRFLSASVKAAINQVLPEGALYLGIPRGVTRKGTIWGSTIRAQSPRCILHCNAYRSSYGEIAVPDSVKDFVINPNHLKDLMDLVCALGKADFAIIMSFVFEEVLDPIDGEAHFVIRLRIPDIKPDWRLYGGSMNVNTDLTQRLTPVERRSLHSFCEPDVSLFQKFVGFYLTSVKAHLLDTSKADDVKKVPRFLDFFIAFINLLPNINGRICGEAIKADWPGLHVTAGNYGPFSAQKDINGDLCLIANSMWWSKSILTVEMMSLFCTEISNLHQYLSLAIAPDSGTFAGLQGLMALVKPQLYDLKDKFPLTVVDGHSNGACWHTGDLFEGLLDQPSEHASVDLIRACHCLSLIASEQVKCLNKTAEAIYATAADEKNFTALLVYDPPVALIGHLSWSTVDPETVSDFIPRTVDGEFRHFLIDDLVKAGLCSQTLADKLFDGINSKGLSNGLPVSLVQPVPVVNDFDKTQAAFVQHSQQSSRPPSAVFQHPELRGIVPGEEAPTLPPPTPLVVSKPFFAFVKDLQTAQDAFNFPYL